MTPLAIPDNLPATLVTPCLTLSFTSSMSGALKECNIAIYLVSSNQYERSCYHLHARRVALTLGDASPLPFEVHVRADAVAALEPVQVSISITGTVSSKEHV